ncbi:MAG TPA: response regulator transcription factor [Candidatus Sulfomarinibacteraceae bacterium]|nr:response regulator transcription factor [Candidatus Sulfomarinibacteraceae bacterium]
MNSHILLVDDDALMRRSLSFNLEKANYKVMTAASAEDALAAARTTPPDLVLLDINLPGMDGLEALRHFRREMAVPIIFLTARRRELDEVLGLELGADDYVTKPFDPDVLIARIKAVLRRARRQGPPQLAPVVAGDITVDPAAHTVTVGGERVELPAREFDLLHVLAAEAGRVLSTDELLNRVWGAEFSGEPQNVYVHIRWLREKIEDDPQNPGRIVTIRGVGYKLVPQDES